MKLENKKELASRALQVGKNRIVFNSARLNEVKEAITKQDIRDLLASGAIHVRPIKGRKTIVKRESRRHAGSVKKMVINSKREYITLTRKLRSFVLALKRGKKISSEQFLQLRKEIRNKMFKNKTQLKERVSTLNNNA